MQIRSQFLIQLVGGVANTVLLILLAPVLIDTLGLTRYGALLIVLGLTIYVGVAEFGLGPATAQRIAAAGQANADRSAIFGTALALSGGLGILAGLLFSTAALPGVGVALGLDATSAAELMSAGPGLFLLGFGTVAAGAPQGVLFGLGSFVALNIVGILSTAASVLAPAAYAVLVSPDLDGLILAVAIARLLTAALALALCYQAGVGATIGRASRDLVRGLLGYGGWTTLTVVLHRISNSIDRPLVGAYLGAAWVPVFTIPQGLLTRSSVIVVALTSAVFPRIAASASDSERARLINNCYRSVCVLAPLYVLGILLLPTLLSLWLGADFGSRAASVSVLLALSIWIDAIGVIPYMLLQATGQVRRETMVAAAITIPNILLLLPALLLAGIEGAGVVAVLRSCGYLAGRLWATRHIGFPALDVGAQSAFVVAAVPLSIFVAADQRLLIGILLVSASLVGVALRRPPFVDHWFQRARKAMKAM